MTAIGTEEERSRAELKVDSHWRTLLDDFDGADAPPTTIAEPLPKKMKGLEIIRVSSLFSKDECERLIEASEREGFGYTNYPQNYRGNLRLSASDPGLAEATWVRIERLVPSTLKTSEGTWDAIGLNEVWRLAKYHPGTKFQSHVDACFPRNSGERSMFTVNINLNEDCTGGHTRFYKNSGSTRLIGSFAPTIGAAVIFRQPPGAYYEHDGEEVKSGLKYLLRTDVMYRLRVTEDEAHTNSDPMERPINAARNLAAAYYLMESLQMGEGSQEEPESDS